MSQTANGIAVPSKSDVLSEINTSCGRNLLILRNANGERLEVRAPDGAVEMEIEFTERGPVARLHAVALEVDADELSMNCRRIALNAQEDVSITGKEFRAKTENDIVMNGAFVRLNCDEDSPSTT